MTNKTNKTNMTNTTELKQFINSFNFDNPAWFRLPYGFPDVNESGLSREEKIALELIRAEWRRAGSPESNMSNLTNKTYKTNRSYKDKPHGGYRKLEAFKMSEIIYDFTVEFHKTNKSNMTYRTWVQMEQAARSGKQNTCLPAGRSPKEVKGPLFLPKPKFNSSTWLGPGSRNFWKITMITSALTN